MELPRGVEHSWEMFNILIRPPWFLPEKTAINESAFLRRREFLSALGLGGAGLAAAGVMDVLGAEEAGKESTVAAKSRPLYPAPRNPRYNPGWTLTDENVAARYNNFYEFSMVKNQVHQLTGKFVIDPWKIEISGLVEKPFEIDAHELIREMPLEDRVYRFRCVEAWSMVVPWTGFQLSKLIEKAKPKAEAKFVRFETFNRPDQAPGMKGSNYPFPYFEGLRMDEAMHPLTLIATGIFGKPMPKQHGAPVRLIVPWKYGYKSIKSIVKIEFLANQPKTFWEVLAADEYPFESNVNPSIPHPRWLQSTERVIDTGDRIRTLPYNGYGDQVAKLYSKV